jgi:biopolymer transport protein ExbB
VTFDFSRGAALKQLTHRSSLKDKIKKGGIIVWPILGIGLLALGIALERTLFLNRVHANTDRLMGRVNQLAGRGDWAGCDDILKPEKGKPVYNVLRAGLSAVNEKRETLESVLQEAILKELPRLERFLPALNIMGAVAPLLGLLGTVTGMIGTFQSITLYGTGDPRMMSGGISEALITTMLGLAVAIPIMLVHTFLRRRLEHIVGDMEEKAVALSNIICRECALVQLIDEPDAAPTAMPLSAKASGRARN